MKIALIVLNDVGLGLARRLQPTLDGAVVHGLHVGEGRILDQRPP